MAGGDPQRKILVLALISVVAVTWRELKAGDIPPAPSNYVGTAIVYGVATVASEASGQLGLYLALAWTLVIAYSLVGQGRGTTAKAQGLTDKTPSNVRPLKAAPKARPARRRPVSSSNRR